MPTPMYAAKVWAGTPYRPHFTQGRALITAVYAAADEAGAPSVYWLTQEGNTTARQLYDRIATPTDFMKYQRPL